MGETELVKLCVLTPWSCGHNTMDVHVVYACGQADCLSCSWDQGTQLKPAWRQEVRGVLRARKLGVLTPCVLCVEHEASTIYFERVTGMPVKQALHDGELQPEGAPGAARVCRKGCCAAQHFCAWECRRACSAVRCAALSRWQLQHALQATETQVKHDVHASALPHANRSKCCRQACL